VKEYSLVFEDEYHYYRITLTVTASESPSITFTASLLETYIDRWIIWLSLSLIYHMISKSTDDGWLKRSEDAINNFNLAFDNYTFTVDKDEDNLVA
jgi:hypothetical protein